MLLRFLPYFIAILYALIANTVATIPKNPSAGEITHITSNIKIFDKEILQLQVNWNDTLPKDTRYNVIVSALNLTDCPDACSAYDIPKPTEYVLIPENPFTYVENMECNYMPGCNYSLKIETSNTMISKLQPFSIPYCVEHICSCQHAATLPPVTANLNVTTNRTIDIIWHIDTHQLKSFAMGKVVSGNELSLSSIYMKLNKQTNPSLSWGGKHIPIAENFYPIQNISHILESKDMLKGIIRIEMNEALAPKTVLFLRVHVIDTLRCAGPEKIIKIEVPMPSLAFTAIINNDIDLRIGLIIVTTLFVLVVAAALAFLIWKRQKAKNHIHINKDEQYFAPLAGVIGDMEDNINYVDKYIEDAQIKGLADIFEIPHHAIRIGPEIGEGAFGRVYKATAINIRRMRGTTVVAVKQLKKNPTADEVAEFLSEIEMLKGVGTHNNIVSFLCCCTIRSPYLMVMEYVGRGDLLSYLRTVRQETSILQPRDANCACSTTVPNTQNQGQYKPTIVPVSYIELKVSEESIYDEAEEERRPKPSFAETTYTIIDGDDPYGVEPFEPFQYILNHKELHNFALQIANGMRFLEEQEITHRDLAARNVLISENKTLKISDFGLSRHGIYTNTKTRKLPLRWLSIEAIRDNLYSNKSDVWAYGVVLWEIGTLGASPYPTVSNSELIPLLLSGQRLEKPEICTDEVYKIMQECWLEDPDERPTFEQLYKTLSPKTTYVDINSLSDDYVFPPIQEKIS